MSALHLSVLGGFELRRADGSGLRLPTRKAEALLAYLALGGAQSHPREHLANLLWSDAAEKDALASLRQALYCVARVCGREALHTVGRSVALHQAAFVVDRDTFVALSQGPTPMQLLQAVELYRGELLAGNSIGEPLFEDWLRAERERCRERAIDVHARCACQLQADGELDAALQTWLRLLEIDPLLESGHRGLMQLYARQGRRAAALRQYQVCVTVLQRQLGAEPEHATRQLYHTLLSQLQHAGVHEADAADPLAPQTAGVPTPISAAEAAAVTPVHEAPMIGRSVELAALVAASGRARSGRGACVALLGEAGMGKTRLTEELASRAIQEGTRVLKGHCHESQQMLPLGPWVDMMRSVGVASDTTLTAALDPALRIELASLLPELGVGPAPPASESAALVRQARLFESVVQVMALFAASSPVLLVLEDLHWADDMSLRLLAALVRRAGDWPLALVFTAREEELPAAVLLRRTLRELAQGQRVTTVLLHPLSHDDTAALVQALRRGSHDSRTHARLTEQVWRASEGNPFVVVESVRAWVDEPPPAAAGALTLPERVRELIAGHLERLSPPARRLVAAVAVAGREIDFPLLQQAVCQEPDAACQALEELVRCRMLQLVGESFDVSHARIRQVLLDDLLPPTRRALHLALARALEQRPSHDPAALNERLAYHYAHTDEHAKAVVHLAQLSQWAAHEGAHDQALASLGQAQAHLVRAHPPLGEAMRLDLVLRQARSLFFLGRFLEVLDLLMPEQPVVDASADPRLAAAYYLRRGSTRTYLGDHAGSTSDAERALQEARACDDDPTMGKAHFLLSLEHFWASPELGVQHGRQAVEQLERGTETWWLGQACWILGLNLSYLGRFAEGLAMEARARRLADTSGDRRLASYAAWTTGFIHTLAGQSAASESACSESVALALDPLNRMTAQGMLALARVERGAWADALPVLEEAIPRAVSFGIPQMHGLFLAFRGEARLLAGDLQAAQDDAALGVRITAEAGYRYGQGWGQRVLGRIAHHRSDWQGADTHMSEAICTFSAMGARFEAGRTQIELAEWLTADARPNQALPLARAGLAAVAPLALVDWMRRAQDLVARLEPLQQPVAPALRADAPPRRG